MIDLDELERLAKAATPGPWRWTGPDDRDEELGGFNGRDGQNVCSFGMAMPYDNVPGDPPAAKDATFIAAANPAAVLELIARIRQLTIENATRPEILNRAEREYDDRHVAQGGCGWCINGGPDGWGSCHTNPFR